MSILPPSPFLNSAPCASRVAEPVAAPLPHDDLPRQQVGAQSAATGTIPNFDRRGTRPTAPSGATDERRFVLDEITFFEAIEEIPLFLQYRSVGYLKASS